MVTSGAGWVGTPLRDRDANRYGGPGFVALVGLTLWKEHERTPVPERLGWYRRQGDSAMV